MTTAVVSSQDTMLQEYDGTSKGKEKAEKNTPRHKKSLKEKDQKALHKRIRHFRQEQDKQVQSLTKDLIEMRECLKDFKGNGLHDGRTRERRNYSKRTDHRELNLNGLRTQALDYKGQNGKRFKDRDKGFKSQYKSTERIASSRYRERRAVSEKDVVLSLSNINLTEETVKQDEKTRLKKRSLRGEKNKINEVKLLHGKTAARSPEENEKASLVCCKKIHQKANVRCISLPRNGFQSEEMKLRKESLSTARYSAEQFPPPTSYAHSHLTNTKLPPLRLTPTNGSLKLH